METQKITRKQNWNFWEIIGSENNGPKHRVPGPRMTVLGFVTVKPSTRSTALEPVTHSLSSLTKVEKIPAGKVVKLHPLMNLIDATRSNDNQKNGGPLASKTLKTKKATPLPHFELKPGQGRSSCTFFIYSVR